MWFGASFIHRTFVFPIEHPKPSLLAHHILLGAAPPFLAALSFLDFISTAAQ